MAVFSSPLALVSRCIRVIALSTVADPTIVQQLGQRTFAAEPLETCRVLSHSAGRKARWCTPFERQKRYISNFGFFPANSESKRGLPLGNQIPKGGLEVSNSTLLPPKKGTRARHVLSV